MAFQYTDGGTVEGFTELYFTTSVSSTRVHVRQYLDYITDTQ